MELYFLRHGAAGKPSEWQGDDRLRPLTEKGTAQVRSVARALVAAGLGVDAVVTSPLVRARQTADIAARELGLGDAVREDERLAGGLDRRVLAGLLADLGLPRRVLLVGHEPDFSSTIGQLTGGSVICRKGGIARVDVADPASLDGQLVWLAPPRLLGGHHGG
jgi:phosphohistidine phosphatase